MKSHRQVKKLNQQDSFHLQAAEGWFELGDPVSAFNELDEITPEERGHPAVLVMRYEIYAQAGKWDVAFSIAEILHRLLPEDVESWLNLACSVRRKKGGGARDALDILLEAEPKFPKEYLVHYNLACCCAQLRQFDEAEKWFRKAMELEEMKVKVMAVDDPELSPLWDSMKTTFWKRL